MNVAQRTHIIGCKASNRGPLALSGVAAIDILLNGGLPIGSLCLFLDAAGQYSEYFAKCFASEGLISGHGLFVGDNEKGDVFLATLPSLVETAQKEKVSDSAPPLDDMLNSHSSIAWRYKNLPVLDASLSQQSNLRYYDRKKCMDVEFVSQCEDVFRCSFDFENVECHYAKILTHLKETLSTHEQYNPNGRGSKKLLRIVLSNVGSPLWSTSMHLNEFIFSVKALVRSKLAIVLLTCSTNLLTPLLRQRLQHYCDAVFRLKALENEDHKSKQIKINSLYAGFKGLIYVEKLPTVNSLHFLVPDCLDLAFKWKRGCFVIEKLHTPPDIVDNANDADKRTHLYGNAQKTASGSCSSNFVAAKLDF